MTPITKQQAIAKSVSTWEIAPKDVDKLFVTPDGFFHMPNREQDAINHTYSKNCDVPNEAKAVLTVTRAEYEAYIKTLPTKENKTGK